MTLSPPRPGTMVKIRGVVGESPERPDADGKVKGEFAYASDLRADGMLFGTTLRSPHAHARIRSIDVSRARAMPGVRAVLTAADLPTPAPIGLMKLDQPVLAHELVRYVGEPVAIVAADEVDSARAAAAAIAVDYEPREPLSDPVAALRPGAAKVHAEGNV